MALRVCLAGVTGWAVRQTNQSGVADGRLRETASPDMVGTHDVDLDQIADERGNPAGLALGMDLDGVDDEHAAHARDGSAPALTKTSANRARCSSVSGRTGGRGGPAE